MKAVIYCTEITETDQKQNMQHMIGERLLEEGLKELYGLDLKLEPRAREAHGKPFLALQPQIHYNISHSGKYAVCAIGNRELGVDIQEEKEADFARMLRRMVPEKQREEILKSENPAKEFYHQWVLREAYIKWTGEGLARDMKKINLEEGWYQKFFVGEGYQAALYAALPMEIEIRFRPIHIL